ncbi:hypothetical protein [Streptomyces sp. NPDC002685]|uniref:hypothetical protein n=1 Tax=Streptomyces sp. NPDC002685 TaxID=3154540 RepID=UPI0033309FF5
MPLALHRDTGDLPVCRFHGVHCRMGANWPMERPQEPFDALLELVIEARRSRGMPTDPHPRDLWQTDRHEKVPKAELRQREQETQELLAAATARNDQIEAGLRDERAAEANTEEQQHG